MPAPETEEALTRGLQAGYGGQIQFKTINRGGFLLKSSHLEKDGIVYHDEWINGGGQELVLVGDVQYTRLYAGGTVDKEILTELGLTEKIVIGELIRVILEQGNKTRLHQDCHPNINGSWKYTYEVLDIDSHLPVTFAKETITYKSQVVFVHDLLLCPVK